MKVFNFWSYILLLPTSLFAPCPEMARESFLAGVGPADISYNAATSPWPGDKHTCVSINYCQRSPSVPAPVSGLSQKAVVCFLLKKQSISRPCNRRRPVWDCTQKKIPLPFPMPTPQSRAGSTGNLESGPARPGPGRHLQGQGRSSCSQRMDSTRQRNDFWIVGSVCLLSSSVFWRLFRSVVTWGSPKQAPALEDAQVVKFSLSRADSLCSSLWLLPAQEWCSPEAVGPCLAGSLPRMTVLGRAGIIIGAWSSFHRF